MGIRITTDDYGVKVWRSDRHGFPQYAITIGTKTEDGERITEYRNLQFRRGVELANGDEIIIRDAFPTLRTWKDKKTGEDRSQEVWMVLDFVYKQQTPKQTLEQTVQQSQIQPAQTSFDDLPDTFSAAKDDIPFRP